MNPSPDSSPLRGLAVALPFSILVWTAFCCGCVALQRAIDDWSAEPAAEEEVSAPEGDGRPGETQEEETGCVLPPARTDPSPSGVFSASWAHGGFDGSKAIEDPRCRISSLKVAKDGLSLKWVSGIPADWKRSGEGFVVAAVFHRDSAGRWIGGKFDWIDEKRRSRDFKNLDSGYHGWNAQAFRTAKNHAFVVVSADGKYRSNVIED